MSEAFFRRTKAHQLYITALAAMIVLILAACTNNNRSFRPSPDLKSPDPMDYLSISEDHLASKCNDGNAVVTGYVRAQPGSSPIGLATIRVTLFDENDNLITSETTDVFGDYEFSSSYRSIRTLGWGSFFHVGLKDPGCKAKRIPVKIVAASWGKR